MAYKLIISKDVHFDIDCVIRYMVDKLKNQTAAIGFLDDIEKSYQNIVENPLMYGFCNDDKLRSQGYRKIPIKNYIILYLVDEKVKTITVMRILYGGRNYSDLV